MEERSVGIRMQRHIRPRNELIWVIEAAMEGGAAVGRKLSRSPATINRRRIASEVVPKPSDGLFG